VLILNHQRRRWLLYPKKSNNILKIIIPFSV
jgi:hypothetical protein